MILNVYAICNDIVKATSDDNHNIIELKNKKNKRYKTVNYWLNRTSLNDNFTGNNKDVINKYYGQHEYEAKEIYNIIKYFDYENKIKKKLCFVNKQQQGFKVDVNRYLSGDNRCFFNMKKLNSTMNNVRIFAPIGGSAEKSEKSLKYNGSLTCIITEILEYNNMNVEIYAGCISRKCIRKIYNRSERDDIATLIKIKDTNEYCDYGKIAYITGDHHFYRNIVFRSRMLNSLNLKEDEEFFSMGYSGDINKNILLESGISISDSDIFIPRVYSESEMNSFIEAFKKKIKE